MIKIEYLFTRRGAAKDNFTSLSSAESFVRKHGKAGVGLYLRGRDEKGNRTSCCVGRGGLRTVAEFRAIMADSSTVQWVEWIKNQKADSENQRVSIIAAREAAARNGNRKRIK